jgi:thiosulfate dehydrogenase (quinone) large subunit
VRPASVCGAIYMLTLLLSANYPGPHAAFWQYFGASLDHLVLALCFVAFVTGDAAQVFSLRRHIKKPSAASTAGLRSSKPFSQTLK